MENKRILTCSHLSLHATWRSFLPLSTSFIISDQSGRRRGRVLQSEINYAHVHRATFCGAVGGATWWYPLLSSLYATHFSFSRVFFCVSVSTRFSPGANGGGGGGGALGTSDGSGGGAGTASKTEGGQIDGEKWNIWLAAGLLEIFVCVCVFLFVWLSVCWKWMWSSRVLVFILVFS